jgi:hypothetical protein
MGKKRTRTSTTSKGERRSVVAGVKEVRQARTVLDKMKNKVDAWKKGQNPWITVPGTGPTQLFKRVRANTEWGDPKKLGSIFGREE